MLKNIDVEIWQNGLIKYKDKKIFGGTYIFCRTILPVFVWVLPLPSEICPFHQHFISHISLELELFRRMVAAHCSLGIG